MHNFYALRYTLCASKINNNYKNNILGQKLLMEPGANFINVLQAAFVHTDPERAKKDSQVVSLFLCFRDLSVQKLLVEH